MSGAHLNPVVSLADAVLGRRSGTGLAGRELAVYLPAQLLGGAVGALLANLMFDLRVVSLATTDRLAAHVLLGEVVATAGLVALVFALARTGETSAAPAAIGGYIGAAYFFTSSTSFANPAVTAARALSDTFAGIAPGSVPGFVAAQLIGAALGVGAVRLLYPDLRRAADAVVIPATRSEERS